MQSRQPLSVFHHPGGRFHVPSAFLEASGLKVECVALAGEVTLEVCDDIRICVPMGADRVCVTLGAGREAEELQLQAESIAIVRPRQPCDLSTGTPGTLTVLRLEVDHFRRQARELLGADYELAGDYVATDAYLRTLAHVLKASLRVGRPPHAAYLEAVTREIALHLAATYGAPSKRARQRGLSPDRLARSLRAIEENLAQPLRVEDLARLVNMSPFHYARMFKCSTGHSPHFYITMRRVERAKEMLLGSSLPLAKISEALGYATQAHFTGVFRTHAGATPHAYRTRTRRQAATSSAE